MPRVQRSVPSTEDLSSFQKKVKKSGKCLKILGYLLLAVGGCNIGGNLLFLAGIDEFSRQTWYDLEGNSHVFEIDQSGLFFFAMVKIITGIILVNQASKTYNTVRPVLKEYMDAEAGRTNGVVMAERKSKKTLALRKLVG